MKSFSAVRNSKGFLYQLSEQDPFSTYEEGSATQVGWNKSILYIEDFFLRDKWEKSYIPIVMSMLESLVRYSSTGPET